jgi:hypothetical protein
MFTKSSASFILRQKNPVDTSNPYLFKTYFNIILSYTPRTYQQSLPLRCCYKILVRIHNVSRHPMLLFLTTLTNVSLSVHMSLLSSALCNFLHNLFTIPLTVYRPNILPDILFSKILNVPTESKICNRLVAEPEESSTPLILKPANGPHLKPSSQPDPFPSRLRSKML